MENQNKTVSTLLELYWEEKLVFLKIEVPESCSQETKKFIFKDLRLRKPNSLKNVLIKESSETEKVLLCELKTIEEYEQKITVPVPVP